MLFGCSAGMNELQIARDAGLSFVELRGRLVHAMTQEEFDSLRKQLETLELSCVGFNVYCPPEIIIAGPGFDREKARDYARRLAERAGKLGAKQVGIGSPKSRILPADYDRKLADEQLRTFLLDCADLYGAQGVRVALEPLAPCFCNFVTTYDEALDVLDRLCRPDIGLIYDLYSMERGGEVNRTLSDLLPHIFHVHISDDVAGDPYSRCMLHPFKYDLHRQRLLRLSAAGYTGSVSLETDLPLNPAQLAPTVAFLQTI